MYQITLSIDGMARKPRLRHHPQQVLRQEGHRIPFQGRGSDPERNADSGSRAESRARPHGLPPAPLQLRAV